MRAVIVAVTMMAAALAAPAFADDNSPVGLWKNVDDVTGKVKALIRITDNKGEMQGRIEKLFPAVGEDPNPKCNLCEGVNKDQPVIGMMIMSGLKKDGDEFNGGTILDPDNGKVYRSKMTLVESGKKLKVRGYIGMPMLGRSQVWLRQE